MTELTDQLSWPTLRSAIEAGVPVVYRVFSSPPVDIFVDENGRRLGLRLRRKPGDELPASGLAEVSIKETSVAGEPYLEVSTENRDLFREFLAFLLSVGDLMHHVGLAPASAITTALATWRRLLRPQPRLAEPEVIGLWAELWFLNVIIDMTDPQAVRAWTGPLGETHDFRIGRTEIEVKATLSHRRVHTVSGLQQLMESPDHVLFMLSTQLEPAGHAAGHTLPQLIAETRGRMKPGADAEALQSGLDAIGYSDQHAGLYAASYELRTQPRLIPIDAAFPRIVPQMLGPVVPFPQRIEEVTYRVNVEGLGWEYPSPEFLSAIRDGG